MDINIERNSINVLLLCNNIVQLEIIQRIDLKYSKNYYLIV